MKLNIRYEGGNVVIPVHQWIEILLAFKKLGCDVELGEAKSI